MEWVGQRGSISPSVSQWKGQRGSISPSVSQWKGQRGSISPSVSQWKGQRGSISPSVSQWKGQRGSISPVLSLLWALAFVHCFIHTGAQFAKSSYYMDSASDCYISGYLLMRTDSVVNVFSRRPGSSTSDVLQCTVRFKPDDQRAIMDITFTDFIISDSDVTLRVDLTGGGTHTLRAGSPKPSQITSEGGLATVSLTRRFLDDRDYSFGIILRVYKQDDSQLGKDESPVAVGLVVGIVAGIIVFLIFIAIVVVCCYRKKKRQYMARGHGNEHKVDLTSDGISPAHSYGVDNTARNGMSPPRRDGDASDYYNDSPRVHKKLLISPVNPVEYRDHSGSESDSKDPYIMRKYDRSPIKSASVKYEDEKVHRGPQQGSVPLRQRRGEPEESKGRREENSCNQNQSLPPKSPILSALHSNPRFRASFHAAEEEAEERARRISGGGNDDGNESDASMTETWNTTFDTNFDDDPRPPQGSIIKPPPLPPVPKSPKSPLRRENTASIRRAPRPSSSSSEIEQLQNSGDGDGGVSMNPEGDGPPSPSEIVAIRVNDPHSPSTKRKADTQHTLRPNRSQGKNGKEQRKRSPDSRVPASTSSESKLPKSDASKSQTGKVDKSDPRTGLNQVIPEYEGRFKKADSARKKKSKSPRIGRSRSTGSVLDDADSIGRSSTHSGYHAVPRVTADDYEDSDVESNYNPLRRTGSKNSLYASRSSLYGRRRRKNSAGESVYSFVQDDIDYHRPDRDSFKERSLSRRDRGFRSLGDLEMELREQATRSTQTLRECATQTGKGFANVSPGKKTVVKRSKPRSMSSSHTQTLKSKEGNLDTSSSSSGITRPRERKNSASSTSGRSKSKDRKISASSTSGRPKRTRSDSELKKKVQEAEEGKEFKKPGTPKDKPKLKPKPKPRKSTAASVGQLSDDDAESVMTGMTGPIDQSSVVGAEAGARRPVNPAMQGQPMYPPQGYPGYPVGYPPQMAYVQGTGQAPVLVPIGHPSAVQMHGGAVAPNSGVAVPNPVASVPGTAPKPSVSKWEMLCRMTDGEASREGGSYETGSVTESVFSNPYAAQHFPPAYSSAVSDYAGSERSGPTKSAAATSRSSRPPRKSSWDALRNMTDQEFDANQDAPSESNV